MAIVSLSRTIVKKGETMFWENFCRLCKQSGQTPTETVRTLGIAVGSVTKWKNGTLPSKSSLAKIAAHFGVEAQTLFAEGSVGRRGVRIPVCGDVAAGVPISALCDDECDYEEIPADMAAAGEYVALRIHGDSMQPRMEEGDVVIVRVQQTVEDGEIAIVLLDESDGTATATCKKVRFTPEGILLLSFNPDYEPMFFSDAKLREQPLRIFGRVVELRAKFDK